MTKLFMVRHGQTELNAQKVFYGWTDCGLNQRGREQAQEVGRLLEDIQFHQVISSPLKRAQETAALVSGISTGEIIYDSRLQELNFGKWEGKGYQEVAKEDPENWDLWVANWQEVAPPGGEAYTSMYRRIEEWLQEIQEKYSKETLLVVSHLGTMRAIISSLLGMGAEGFMHFHFEQEAYSLLEIKDGFAAIKSINNRSAAQT